MNHASTGVVNVAGRLADTARAMPDAAGVIVPVSSGANRRYREHSFRELDQDSDRLAFGLRQMGVTQGARLALMVRPGFDFVSLVFALFKAGAVQILIDPGMGRKNVLRCLDEAEPQGFIAIPLVHAVRCLLRRRYQQAKFNVTAGRRWFWGGATLMEFRAGEAPPPQLADTAQDDPAAIIFTTGSTGPPKGVLYTHGNFDQQVDQIRDAYQIQPGEIDVACFPLFALFNCAMGVTTVIPRMDFSRPATVDPMEIIGPINDLHATQAFASPAVWERVGRHCQETGATLPSLRRVLSAGAPVSADVLRNMKNVIHPDGDMHTPFGATEALPVATISASEVLPQTAEKTSQGGGVCVGRQFNGIQWKVIRIVDGPIPTLATAEELPPGEIGELIVQGPVVTRSYVNRPKSNAWAKIHDNQAGWHRMGDVGYLDEQQRFWYCGRLTHRVVTPNETLYTIPCEAILNAHPRIKRTALVGLGSRGQQRPAFIIEPNAESFPHAQEQRDNLIDEARQLAASNDLTASIHHFLLHPSFPVDIRHNAKIFREKLAAWAQRRITPTSGP